MGQDLLWPNYCNPRLATRHLVRGSRRGRRFPDHREVKQYLQSMFAAGSMRPEWCFFAEEEDRSLGRVAFWTLPGMEEPFALVLLDVSWEGDYVDVGTHLLEDVLNEATRLGARELEHVLDDPPMQLQFQHHPEKLVELCRPSGSPSGERRDASNSGKGKPLQSLIG